MIIHLNVDVMLSRTLFDIRIERLIQEKFKNNLTHMQKQTFPLVSQGKNVLIIAPTGTGKTEAVILPLLNSLLKNKDKKGIQLLYITPLRALNRNMHKRIEWWCDRLDITKDIRHGDTTQYERMKQSMKPPQVLVTTPETLNAILVNKYLGLALRNVRHVVVDEIHELLDSKRGVQLSMVLERLDKRSIHKIQRIGISATIGNPYDVSKYLCPKKKVEIVDNKQGKKYKISVIYPRLEQTTEKINAELINKFNIKASAELINKLDINEPALARLLKIKELASDRCNGYKKTLIFVNTRATAESLAARLKILKMNVGIHHGSLSKKVRLNAETEFKNSKTKILICTSSMELGIDIGDIDQVIQYVSPRQVRRLIQRVGRAGHRLTNISKGYIITMSIEDYIESLAITNLMHQDWIEKERIQQDSYDVIAQQSIGIILEHANGFHNGKLTLGKVHKILSNARTYNLEPVMLSKIFGQLQKSGLIYVERDYKDVMKWVIKPKVLRARMYYYKHLSTIASIMMVIVIDINRNKRVGRLDEKYVMHLSKGSRFITSGRAWEVVSITDTKVFVKGIDNNSFQTNAFSIPVWKGEKLAVSYEVAQVAGRLREEVMKFKKQFGNITVKLLKETIPTDRTIIIESCPKVIVVHTCAGTLVNRTITKILSNLISKKLYNKKDHVKTFCDQYRIIFETNNKLRAQDILTLILEIKGKVNEKLSEVICESHAFAHELTNVARLFGAIRENEKINKNLSQYYKGSVIYTEAINSMKFKYYDVETTERFFKKIDKNKKIMCYDNTEPGLWATLGASYF